MVGGEDTLDRRASPPASKRRRRRRSSGCPSPTGQIAADTADGPLPAPLSTCFPPESPANDRPIRSLTPIASSLVPMEPYFAQCVCVGWYGEGGVECRIQRAPWSEAGLRRSRSQDSSVLRPPPMHLRLVSVCEPMTSNIHDDGFRARPPACEQPRLSTSSHSAGPSGSHPSRLRSGACSEMCSRTWPRSRFRIASSSLLEALEAQEKRR